MTEAKHLWWVISFVLVMIAITCVVGVNMLTDRKNDRQACEDMGGTFLSTKHTGNVCLAPGMTVELP